MTDELQAHKTTREDMARQAQEHYEKISTQAQDWNSTIPAAIYAWQREPLLVDALKAMLVFMLEDDELSMEKWDPIEELASDALSEAMGETAFARWIAEITDDPQGPEYLP